jgi:hypothetical protein
MGDDEEVLETEVFKTVIAVGPQLLIGDAIHFQGAFWIVPEWLESSDQQWCKPKRLICLANLQHQDFRNQRVRTADFAVNEPIPKDVLEGKMSGQPASKFIVIEMPPFRIRKSQIH